MPTGKPLDIQITATNSGLDVDVRGSGPLSISLDHHAVAHRGTASARPADAPRRTGADANAAGRDHRRRAGDAAARLVPAGDGSRRGNAGGARGPSICKRAKHIADLFCGVGPFALRLAAKSRVAAFDSDAGAVTALQKAATSTSGLKPVKAEARDLFRRPLMPQELRDYDAVVFDPPRQGAQAQATQLAASKVPTVVAVSCNVTTFARDAKILIDGGYKIDGVTPVDQFRHTPHVELVARFRR